MTKQKALKRDVRTRMTKTGERYTAARRHVAADTDPWVTNDLGVSDAKITQATGCDWATWIYVLDRWGAKDRTHTEIARHLGSSYDVTGWWAQTITVGYERARGMRAPHQRPDGFAVGVSKTFRADTDTLRPWFADARRRSRWIERGALTARPTRTERNLRFDTTSGGRVAVSFDAKPGGKTTVAIQHERLTSAADVEPTRAWWKERLATLATLID
jgi:hypothetical protein